MLNHPTTFAEWQKYPKTLDPIHVAWLKNAKKSKTSFAVADIEGVEISHKKFLTGVLLFSKKIEDYSPEQNVGLLLPILHIYCAEPNTQISIKITNTDKKGIKK